MNSSSPSSRQPAEARDEAEPRWVSPKGVSPKGASPEDCPPIFLIGYRGTGKSSVGLILSRELRVPFLDTDRMVEDALKVSIAEVFSRAGEETFRRKEGEALRRAILNTDNGGPVVATGGGIVLRSENVEAMRGVGWVVWLTATAPAIRSRLAADPKSGSARPPLAGGSALDEVEEVLRIREPLYRAAADVEVSTEGVSPDRAAAKVVEWLRTAGGRAGAAS